MSGTQPRTAEPPPQPQNHGQTESEQALRERAKRMGLVLRKSRGMTGYTLRNTNKDLLPAPADQGVNWRLDQIAVFLTTGKRPSPVSEGTTELDPLAIPAILARSPTPTTEQQQPGPDLLAIPFILDRATAKPTLAEPTPAEIQAARIAAAETRKERWPQPTQPTQWQIKRKTKTETEAQPQPRAAEPQPEPSPKAKKKAKAPKTPTKSKAEILSETISQSGALKAAMKAAEAIAEQDAALEASDDFYKGLTRFAVAVEEVRKNPRLLDGLLQGRTKPPGNETQPLVKAFFRGRPIDPSRVTRIAQCLEECQHQGVPPADTGNHVKKFVGGMRALAEQYRTRKRKTSNTEEAEQERAEANHELIATVTGLLGDPSIRLKPLPDYTTVFSASELRPEGSIRLFPVRIFPADGDRPNGAWEVFEALPLDETATLRLIQQKVKKASEEKA